VHQNLVVRSWNVFHGNAHPPRRQGFLRQMLELITGGEPDLICLQELPVWSLDDLQSWTGMTVIPGICRPALWPAPVSAWITRLHQGLLRSTISGQANAILVRQGHRVEDLGQRQISDPGRERRVCQAIRVNHRLIVANLHATNEFQRPNIPRAELTRARALVEELAGPDDCVVLAGDFNLHDAWLNGYSPPGPGIDHILARGAIAASIEVWPVERRTQCGIVLSDHAPVELAMQCPEHCLASERTPRL
jgi:endonuclease/exonuclease/phosphatase family metal-dependent hydrolase